MEGKSHRLRWQAAPRIAAVTGASAQRSRFVGLMRYALPLVAVALVALVVAWPRPGGPVDGFRLTFASVDTSTPEPAMLNARYVGTDRKDRPFVITADRARQAGGDPDVIVLETPQADFSLANGTWIALSADEGVYYRAREMLRLDGGIDLFSDTGFAFSAESAEVDLAGSVVVSERPVRGQGPLGTLDAGNFRALVDERRFFFAGGVKLVILPGAPG